MNDTSEKDDNRSDEEGAVPTADFGVGSIGPGNKIGRYKLLSILGEGGYGIVYLAEQQRPVKRRVALKVIKPGMDTKQVIARFEAERQALALLDHPNIAHVYDAGTTKNGRPYFVMEYVKGVPITEHCDLEKLAIDERLGLFLKICEAVQHAHQKGIIHRDIKPSNVQVAIHGAHAVPKIIDFGVAKAISQPLTERTLVTEQGQFVGTPEYMSPEQAEMTTQDIDTRTDIYSLGVVLYELLTSTLPFDSKTLRGGGIDHIRHIIREEDPKTPSTRLNTISGEESMRVAQLRRTDVRTLGRKLHGDLDWITIKAMEKDRMRRYQTAHALAEDVQRHLSHEPVLSGPPSKVYRMKKFLRKHRTQAVATAMIAALLVCVMLMAAMFLRGHQQSEKAKALEHKEILSKAMELRSSGQFQDALTKVETILDSKHVGPKAHLLHARLVLELQGPTEAVKELQELLEEEDDIAGQAHFLLARIYYESDPDAPGRTEDYHRKWEYHQQKGEKLFSKSAEAYFNRAMLAGTVNDTLECLDKAIEFESGHYDSREAQALAYYALNRYDEMEIDASVMIGNEPNNSQGYALRAIARREKAIRQNEKDLLVQAIRDHNKAIGISHDDPELYDQRRRTYMQVGDYKQALSDARACVDLEPDKAMHHFHVFCALVAFGEYYKAKDKYDFIVETGLMSKRRFDRSAAKYVADTLDAGLSWYPTERRPEGAAFLAMHESTEIYHQLVKKAKRVVPEGFHATWSPDGTELAYSRGIVGFAGIEILNLENEKTRLLTVPGFDPAWSPDGQYIAFTRDRQITLITDLTAEHSPEWSPYNKREIWLIKADSSEEPRFLARGYWPHWCRDSKRVFYHSRVDMMFYSISIEGSVKPISIVRCTGRYPTVSPDEKYVAYRATITGGESQIVEEISTNSVIARLMPLVTGGGFVNWSPDGRKLCIGGNGLWIYDLDKKAASKVLSGTFGWCSWSRSGIRQLAFASASGGLVRDIWVVKLGPNMSAIEALGPGRTIEEHAQEMIRLYTRRIEADPDDADAYLSRAECHVYLREYEKAAADLEQLALLLKSDDVSELTFVMNEFLVNHASGAREQYKIHEYEQALMTLKSIDRLRRKTNSESRPDELAFIAMSLYQIGRTKEAKSTLEELRGLFKNDKNREYLKWLYSAEKVFADENSGIRHVWECIELGKLNDAWQLVQKLQTLPLEQDTDVSGDITRVTKALAEAFYERGINAGYNGHGYSEVISDYEEAVHVDPNYARAFCDLAWLQAACPETNFRDDKKAIENATRACELTNWKDHRYVSVLAAVYAKVGDFDNAVEWQKKTIDLLTADNRANWQAIYESCLKLFKSGKPYEGGYLWSFSTGRMIGWWKFDEGRGETTHDWSGYGNHGILEGDPQWVDGIMGGALDLDGSDFVTIDSVVDDIASNNITVSAWVKTTTSIEGELFACNTSGNSHPFMFGITDGRLFVYDSSCEEGHTPITVNDGQWYMWTYVRRESTGYIYVDAVQQSEHQADFDLTSQPRWSIGQEWDYSDPSNFLTGTVDDARFYTYPLSGDEIKALYASRDSRPKEN